MNCAPSNKLCQNIPGVPKCSTCSPVGFNVAAWPPPQHSPTDALLQSIYNVAALADREGLLPPEIVLTPDQAKLLPCSSLSSPYGKITIRVQATATGYKALCAHVWCPNDGQPVICNVCAMKAAEAAKPLPSWRDKPPLL